MKKLALVVGSLLSSFELLAGNFVPVWLNVGDDRKAAVYDAVVKNSFVTQLDSKKAANLSEEDKNEIINDESEFLKKKIQSVDPSVKVAFIPKSLYQLFVWNLFLEEVWEKINKNDKVDKKDCCKYVMYNPVWGDCSNVAEIGFGEDGETPKKIGDFCNDYMNSDNVRSYFWKINNSISSFEGILEWEISKEEDLKNVIKHLLENFSINAKKVYDVEPGYFTKHLLMSDISNLSDEFKAMIADLVVKESNVPLNSYRIYRGESSTDSDRDSGVSYSFSDGMFGGIIRDWDSGMAFNHSLSKLHMKIVDLPKEKLLNIKEDFDGIERSGLSVRIPPVISMGAALGAGEFHHVRTKVMINSAKKDIKLSFNQGVGGSGEASVKGTPWLYSYSSSVTDFWEKLELLNEKTYNLSNKKDLNVKTYRIYQPQHLSDLNPFKRFWGSLKEKVGLLQQNIWSILEPFGIY